MKSVLAVAFVLSCFPYKARAEFDAVEFLGAARAQAAASNAPIAASTKHKIVVEAEEGLTVTLKSATSGFTARNEHRLRCGHLDVDAGVGDVFEPYFRASRQANYKGAPALVSPAGPGAWLVGSDPKKEGGRCNYVSNGQYLRFSVEGPGISDTISVTLDETAHGRYAGNYHVADCRRKIEVTRTRDRFQVPLNVQPAVTTSPDGDVYSFETKSDTFHCQTDREVHTDGGISLVNGSAEVKVSGGASETHISFKHSDFWRPEDIRPRAGGR